MEYLIRITYIECLNGIEKKSGKATYGPENIKVITAQIWEKLEVVENHYRLRPEETRYIQKDRKAVVNKIPSRRLL